MSLFEEFVENFEDGEVVNKRLRIKSQYLCDSWNFYFSKNGKVFYYGYLKNFEQKLREWLKKGKKKDRVIDIALLFAIRK